jgi:hypothetical protein
MSVVAPSSLVCVFVNRDHSRRVAFSLARSMVVGSRSEVLPQAAVTKPNLMFRLLEMMILFIWYGGTIKHYEKTCLE